MKYGSYKQTFNKEFWVEQLMNPILLAIQIHKLVIICELF